MLNTRIIDRRIKTLEEKFISTTKSMIVMIHYSSNSVIGAELFCDDKKYLLGLEEDPIEIMCANNKIDKIKLGIYIRGSQIENKLM